MEAIHLKILNNTTNKPTTTNPTIRELELGDHVVNQRGTPTVEGTVYSFEDKQIIIKTLSGKYITRNPKTVKKKDSYAGGYLLDPIPGLYSDVSDLDFTGVSPGYRNASCCDGHGITASMTRLRTPPVYVRSDCHVRSELRMDVMP